MDFDVPLAGIWLAFPCEGPVFEGSTITGASE
jgi:hypothetical protein